MESPDTTVVLGIIKKFNKDLEDFPLNTQIAIANTLLQLVQYRTTVEVERSQQEQARIEREKNFSPHMITRPV